MKKMLKALTVTVLMIVFIAGYANAGVWETVKTWLTWEVLALIVSTLLALAGGVLGLMFRKISRTFKEAGEFMTTLGTSIEDRRITRDELAGIIKEGRDIFEVWR